MRLDPDPPLETPLDERPEPSVAGMPAVPGVTIGRILGFIPAIGPLVTFAGNRSPEPLVARVMTSVGEKDAGREVALVFEDGDPVRPIILGVLEPPAEAEAESRQKHAAEPLEVRIDGNRLLLSAREEIVLECGRASITLTRAGKILLSGEYISSRSSGANRIKGGSVQIN
jgi:hypothetical protein